MGVEVQPGDQLEIQDLYASAPPVDLQLHRESGEPWAEAFQVELRALEFEPLEMTHLAWTSASGRVLLPHLPTGQWRVTREAGWIRRRLNEDANFAEHPRGGFGVLEHVGPRVYDLTLLAEPAGDRSTGRLTR